MKKLLYSLATIALLGSTTATAQTTLGDTCTYTVPRIQTTTVHTGTAADTIGGGVWSQIAELQAQNGTVFPTTEFLILKKDASTTADQYPILGASINGVFHPANLNNGSALQPGDELVLVALGFNLPQIKNLVNRLLTGSNAGGTPCCNIVNLASEGFCNIVRNDMNIHSGDDVRDLAQVLSIFDLFSEPGETLNIASLHASMGTVNGVGSILGTCGAEFIPLCYGVDYSQTYKYVISANGVAVNKISDVASFVIFPNPTNLGTVNVTLETTKATDLQVNIYNALGQRLQSENLGSVEGQRNVSVSTANLPAGIYAIELTDGTNRQSQTLIVQ